MQDGHPIDTTHRRDPPPGASARISPGGEGVAHPIPIVIDTDVGADPDDALALVFALASPEVELLGVTVVDGDVDLRARMAARLLGMAGRPDIPVVRGVRRPIGPGRGPTMLGFEGRGLLDGDDAGPEATILEATAPEWLVEASKRRAFHLVAIGPLSNVAVALRLDPTLPDRLLGLTIMGGVLAERALPAAWRRAVRERGAAAWPDHNTASDPTAALVCARSGLPLTWVTSEVTVRAPLRRDGRERLPADHPLGAALGHMVDVWEAAWFHATLAALGRRPPVPRDAVAFLHDPLTVAALFPGEWLTLRAVGLTYAVEDGLFRLREAGGDGGVATRVSVAVDGAGFEAFCLGRITEHIARTGAPSGPAAAADSSVSDGCGRNQDASESQPTRGLE